MAHIVICNDDLPLFNWDSLEQPYQEDNEYLARKFRPENTPTRCILGMQSQVKVHTRAYNVNDLLVDRSPGIYVATCPDNEEMATTPMS